MDDAAAIGHQVAGLILREATDDPRITWADEGALVTVHSTMALRAFADAPDSERNLYQRLFYAALEHRLDGSGWQRSGADTYRHGL
ncbi:MAG: hypothetical protein ACLPQS_04350 [Acidimicrobiales bacterium]